MRRFMIPASVAITLAAAGCHWSADAEERDAGPKVDRNYQVGNFSKIEVAGPYEVKVVTGGQPGVKARGGENLLNETEVLVDGDTLEIRPKKRKGFRWHWNNGSAQRNADGTWTLVVAPEDPGVPNWLDTGGRLVGSLTLRWVLAGESPPAPDCAVVPLASLRRG